MANSEIEDVRLKVQWDALELIVAWLLAAHFKRFPDPGQAADEMQELAEAVADRMSYEDLDPAMSDLASQEFRDSLVRRVLRSRALATGVPFDPEAFRGRGPKDAV